MGIIVSSHRFPSDQTPSSDVISKITLNVRLPLPNIQNQRFWEACIKVLPSARTWSNVSTIKNMAYSYMKPSMDKLNRTAIYGLSRQASALQGIHFIFHSTLTGKLNSVPSMHFWQLTTNGPNYSSRESDSLFWSPQALHSPAQTHTQTNIYTYFKHKNLWAF